VPSRRIVVSGRYGVISRFIIGDFFSFSGVSAPGFSLALGFQVLQDVSGKMFFDAGEDVSIIGFSLGICLLSNLPSQTKQIRV